MGFYNETLSLCRVAAKSLKASLAHGDYVTRPTGPPDKLNAVRSLSFARAAAIGCLALVLFAFGCSMIRSWTSTPTSPRAITPTSSSEANSDHRDWLDYYAFDLQPVPKYLIGASMRFAHLRMPGPADAWLVSALHAVRSPTTLTAARIPFLFIGALGCIALFGCGVLIKDRRVARSPRSF